MDLSTSQRVISPEEVVSSPIAEDILLSAEILPFPPLNEEINPSLSVKLAVTVTEGDVRHDYTDVPQGPPIVASRPILRVKAKQIPRGETESVVHKYVCY